MLLAARPSGWAFGGGCFDPSGRLSWGWRKGGGSLQLAPVSVVVVVRSLAGVLPVWFAVWRVGGLLLELAITGLVCDVVSACFHEFGQRR
jgi:non-ribosomal peptide synthetase component F